MRLLRGRNSLMFMSCRVSAVAMSICSERERPMSKHNVTMLKMDISETPKAFNINGITFSKKRLAELFPGWGCDIKTFYRLMIIMPFFASQKRVEEAPTVTGKYAI